MGEHVSNESTHLPFDVIIYTDRRILTGVLRLPPNTRPTDRLNTSPDDFVPLHEPRIIDLERGWVDTVPNGGPWFVQRREILILHEVSTVEARARVIGIPEERVPKQPTPIRAYVGAFRLEGKIHLPPDTEIGDYLDQTSGQFLPMTAVQISLPGRDDIDVVQVPFTLVNRDRLIISSP